MASQIRWKSISKRLLYFDVIEEDFFSTWQKTVQVPEYLMFTQISNSTIYITMAMFLSSHNQTVTSDLVFAWTTTKSQIITSFKKSFKITRGHKKKKNMTACHFYSNEAISSKIYWVCYEIQKHFDVTNGRVSKVKSDLWVCWK